MDKDKVLEIADSTQHEWFKFSKELFDHAKSKGIEIHYAALKDAFFYWKIAELQDKVKTQQYQINVLQECKLNKEGI